MSTAVLIDGGFFKKRHKLLYGKFPAPDLAEKMVQYALSKLKAGEDGLYRIFYYDCAPHSYEAHTPISKTLVKFANTPESKFQQAFLEELKSKRKVAIRLGEFNKFGWKLYPRSLTNVLKGITPVTSLTDKDYVFSVEQKGVDMKMGLDIASLAYKRLVNQILLISGDSDFVPAAKLARREGIDFVLDPMGNRIKPSLHEHVDGIIGQNYLSMI